jgi:hypothetical protein
MWSYMADPRYVWGFFLEVERVGPDGAKVVVYPADKFWERKSREWLTKTVAREFNL